MILVWAAAAKSSIGDQVGKAPSFAHKLASPRTRANIGANAARRGERITPERILAELDSLRRSSTRRVPDVFYAEAVVKAALGDADGAVRSLRDWVGGQGFDLHAEVEFELIRNDARFREFIRPKG